MSLSRIWRSGREQLGAVLARGPLSDLKWTLLGLVVFSAAYLAAYASQEMLPGEHPMPTWEHWHDQGQYLRSARAFADGNLAASEHWYPPGYSLLAVPFVHLTPANPFVIPDFVCFILYFLGFMRLTREWLPPLAALFCFGLGTLYPPFLLCQYIFPWNTIPIAALIVWLLVLADRARQDGRLRLDILIGFMAGMVIAIRQIEAVAIVPIGVAYILSRAATRRFASIGLAAIPVALLPISVACVILKINGSLATPYVKAAADFGFSPMAILGRMVPVFLDGSVYNEPHAAIREFQPFVIAALPWCVVGCILQPRRLLLPIATCFAAIALYLSYNDFSPINVVRFYLVHYIEWTFPVIIATAVATATLLVRKRRFVAIAAMLLITTGLLLARDDVVADGSWRIARMEAGRCGFVLTAANPQRINAVDLLDIPYTASPSAFAVAADGQTLRYRQDYETVAVVDGSRVVFKRRFVPRELSINLSPDQYPHCTGGVVRPQRSVLGLDLTWLKPRTHTIPAERMYREIGSVQADDSGATARVAGANEEGWVAFGPREDLPEGRYTATFVLTATGTPVNSQDPNIYYDVVAEDRKSGPSIALGMTDDGKPGPLVTLGSTTGRSAPGPQRVSVDFDLVAGMGKLNYRVRKPMGYDMRFVGVEIARK